MEFNDLKKKPFNWNHTSLQLEPYKSSSIQHTFQPSIRSFQTVVLRISVKWRYLMYPMKLSIKFHFCLNFCQNVRICERQLIQFVVRKRAKLFSIGP